MATTKNKKTQPYVPSYANGGIQYTGSGATPAGKRSASGTQVTSIRNADGSLASANQNVKANEFDNQGIQVIRDATGIKRLIIPGKGDFNNLTNEQAQRLILDYKNRPLSADEEAAREKAQFQAELDKANRKTEFLQSQPEFQALLAEQAQPVTEEIAPPDETSQSIEENIQRQKLSELAQSFTSAEQFIDPNTGEPYNIKWFESTNINKFIKNAPNSKTKTWILNMASENPDWQRYLDGYSNEKNFESIKTRNERSDIAIGVSKERALIPGESSTSNKIFEDAVAQKRRDLEDLKQITANDPRLYAQQDVRDLMAEIQDYLDKQEFNDRTEMQANQRQALMNKLRGGMQ